MVHTLRNRKTGRKTARPRFTEARRRSETAVSPHLAGMIRDSNADFQVFVGSKPRV